MESFNLNIIPGKDRPVCHASQYDIGRTIRVNLFEGFNVFTLDGTEVISISVRKPDGNVVTASVTNTSDSFVEIVTTEQMTACHGANLCELKIEKGADVIGTMNFILEVEQDPLEGGIASQSEIDNLATQVAAIVADQYDSNNVIFDAAPTPGHGIGYTVTSEGIGQAIDDAVDDLSDTLAPVATSGSYNDLTDTPSVAVIDDDTASASSVYSSDKVEDLLALKQDATDSNLQTTDTTVVGAINELKNDIVTSNFWKIEKLTIANGVAVNAGVETAPVTVSIPQYTGYTVLTFTEVRATGYHGAKITVQAELANATELVYALYNPSSVNATVTVTVRVIYVKTIT